MLEGEGILSFLLNTLVPRLPVIAVTLAGAVVALTWWGRQPRVALLAFLGCGLQLLITVVGMFWWTYLPRLLDLDGGERVAWFYSASGICFGVVDAAGMALIIWAVFVGRSEAPPRSWQRLGPGPDPRSERPYPRPPVGPEDPTAFRE
jgi:hypothetical protein